MKLSNKTYDRLKWALTIAAPAIIVLINALSPLYHYDANLVTATISAVATFVGLLFMISSNQYKKDGKK